MLVLVVFLYSFSYKRNAQREIKKCDIVFVGENQGFIKKEMVNKLLIENRSLVSGIKKEHLNLDKMEQSVNKYPLVEKSEVYVTVDGVLRAEVKPRTPIGRVFNDESSFYIDDKGVLMPLSDVTTAHVPLVSGTITNKNRKSLAAVLKKIYDDDFLKKNIIGVQITPENDLEMYNRNFDYQIEFGRMIHIDSKFKNYKAFFQKAITDSSLVKYKKINLRFTKQVVCTR
jgi:cell division protein FtsQ